jgi:hypothetical protein
MYKSVQKGCEIGLEKGVLSESRSTSTRADKSFQIGRDLADEVKGVASAR